MPTPTPRSNGRSISPAASAASAPATPTAGARAVTAGSAVRIAGVARGVSAEPFEGVDVAVVEGVVERLIAGVRGDALAVMPVAVAEAVCIGRGAIGAEPTHLPPFRVQADPNSPTPPPAP